MQQGPVLAPKRSSQPLSRSSHATQQNAACSSSSTRYLVPNTAGGRRPGPSRPTANIGSSVHNHSRIGETHTPIDPRKLPIRSTRETNEPQFPRTLSRASSGPDYLGFRQGLSSASPPRTIVPRLSLSSAETSDSSCETTPVTLPSRLKAPENVSSQKSMALSAMVPVPDKVPRLGRDGHAASAPAFAETARVHGTQMSTPTNGKSAPKPAKQKKRFQDLDLQGLSEKIATLNEAALGRTQYGKHYGKSDGDAAIQFAMRSSSLSPLRPVPRFAQQKQVRPSPCHWCREVGQENRELRALVAELQSELEDLRNQLAAPVADVSVPRNTHPTRPIPNAGSNGVPEKTGLMQWDEISLPSSPSTPNAIRSPDFPMFMEDDEFTNQGQVTQQSGRARPSWHGPNSYFSAALRKSVQDHGHSNKSSVPSSVIWSPPPNPSDSDRQKTKTSPPLKSRGSTEEHREGHGHQIVPRLDLSRLKEHKLQ